MFSNRIARFCFATLGMKFTINLRVSLDNDIHNLHYLTHPHTDHGYNVVFSLLTKTPSDSSSSRHYIDLRGLPARMPKLGFRPITSSSITCVGNWHPAERLVTRIGKVYFDK